MVFVGLEKEYDTVPRDLTYHCLKRKGVPEEYVRAMQYMYKDYKTSVVTTVGEASCFM